ncbi:hypothetical protein GGI02_004717 [Coemansia sp. RSA 2322]|nr:hypothetical protein GGI02_004717 [Coemansia sp. RSA 2322]
MVVWLAVVAFYVLDFAINCIQASLRALIVDSLPASLQDAGTAWASRMIGIGNTVGYLMGFLDLARLLPFLGSSHMQVLTSIASLVLALTVAITCYYTPETPIARLPSHLRNGSSSGLRALAAIFASIRSLPTTVRDVCRVQLFSWIGWFPFLFYGTTYVANLYVADNSGDGTGGPDLMEKGTRAGSLAMFAYALSSLGFSVILPYFAYSSTAHAASRQHRASIDTQSTFGRIMQIARKVRLAASASLATIWMVSLGVFAIAMLFTFAVSTARGATWLVAVCGFCWAVTIWVPFSIIGQVISSGATSAGQPARTENRDDGYIYVEATDIAMDDLSFNTHDGQPRELFENDEAAHHYPLDSSSISAGTVLGIHNIFIVLPQFITAFVSSLIFAYFEHANRSKPEKTGGEHAHEVALVLRLGGMSSAVAVYYAWKLRRRV